MDGKPNDTHKCPDCGALVPHERLEVAGIKTCIKCTVFQPIIFTRTKIGGGNERPHVTKMILV